MRSTINKRGAHTFVLFSLYHHCFIITDWFQAEYGLLRHVRSSKAQFAHLEFPSGMGLRVTPLFKMDLSSLFEI